MKTFRKWSVGSTYETRIPLADEMGKPLPMGAKIRLVAIAPKVYLFPKDDAHDGHPYFFNAVRAEEIDWYEQTLDERADAYRQNPAVKYGARIRANFCVLK